MKDLVILMAFVLNLYDYFLMINTQTRSFSLQHNSFVTSVLCLPLSNMQHMYSRKRLIFKEKSHTSSGISFILHEQ